MHILFLSDNFPPETNAPAVRTFDHARYWVAAGHRVTVVTCAPNFPQGRVYPGYRNRLRQTEVIDGIEIVRVWSYISPNRGFGRRILDHLSFMTTGLLASLFVRRPDVVIGTSPQFFTVCAAWAVAAIRRRPFVFELRDIWPESIRAVGVMKNTRLLDWLEKLELFLYRRARLIIAVTHSFRANLIARGIAAEKIHVVTNGIDSARFSPRPKDRALERELDLEGAFVAGYIGTHGMAHDLDTLLDAAKQLQGRADASDIRLLFVGDGAERDRLVDRAKREDIENVLFLGSVPREEIPRYWSLLDAAIIHLKDEAIFETVIPSKLFEAMAMGIPVLHGATGESARIVTENDCGTLFRSGDATDLAGALLRLRGGRAHLSPRKAPPGMLRYDRMRLADAFLCHLTAIASQSQRAR